MSVMRWRRVVPVTTISIRRPPHLEQTNFSRQSSTGVSAPYRAAISAGSGSTWCWQALHQTTARVTAARSGSGSTTKRTYRCCSAERRGCDEAPHQCLSDRVGRYLKCLWQTGLFEDVVCQVSVFKMASMGNREVTICLRAIPDFVASLAWPDVAAAGFL
jgi:hypothetical protein